MKPRVPWRVRSFRALCEERDWVQDVPSEVRTCMVKVTKPLGKEKTTKLGLDIDYAEARSRARL